MRKETKLSAMIFFSSIFFVLEIVSGYYTGSVALVADSFHMLSDVAALFIALFATKLAKKKNVGIEFSYGLQRAEVLGALINGISLLALSFTLMIEALQRFFVPSVIETPLVVLFVGTAGLVVNIIGISLFHDHSHHSEMMPVPSSEEAADVAAAQELQHPIQLGEKVIRAAALMQQEDLEENGENSDNLIRNAEEVHIKLGPNSNHNYSEPYLLQRDGEGDNDNDHNHRSHVHFAQSNDNDNHDHHQHSHHDHSHSDLNMHGVFLHILGDLLASVGVIASALVIIYSTGNWTVYIDPAISLFITLLIIKSTLPMVKSACYILLHRTPASVCVETVRRDILQVEGVLGIHELHVWQLSQTQTIASVHILVPKPSTENDAKEMEKRYMDLVSRVKARLHVLDLFITRLTGYILLLCNQSLSPITMK